MKKVLILLIGAVTLFTACNKDPKPETNLQLNKNKIELPNTGASDSFIIACNESWTITTDGADWYTLSATSGSGMTTVSVTAPALKELKARSSQISVNSGNKSESIVIIQNPPVVPSDPSKSEIMVQAIGGLKSFEIPSGFDYKVSVDQSWLSVAAEEDSSVKLSVDPNGSDEYRSAKVTVTVDDGSVIAETTVTQSWRNVEPGELLIEEIYFTGSPIEGSENSGDDQYIRLTNNSDHTVYADRVMFVMNYMTGTKTGPGAYYEYPDPGDNLAVDDMYVIPGNGTDHPLAPGESIILAIHAQNYKADNPQAIDLSKADFEFYDENEIYPDTDNPDVENLDIWFKSSFTITILHKRGLESYAIVTPPASETAESIMNDHHWSGERTMYFNEWVFTKDLSTEDVWLIPGEWVLDAVNCSLEDLYYSNPWGAGFDAGWTHAGAYDGDISRYGKSVRRKAVDGKLVDTGNSTNDFTPDAEPTLK